MNALKNVLFFGLLAAVLCGVYISLKPQPEPAIPADLKASDTTLPMVNTGIEITGNNTPNVSPPQQQLPSVPPSGQGGIAPPFQTAGPSNNPNFPPQPPVPSDNGPGNISLPPPPDSAPQSTPQQVQNYPAGVHNPAVADNMQGQFDHASAHSRDLPNNPFAPPPAPDQPPPVQSGPVRSASIDAIKEQVKVKCLENNFAAALLDLSQLYDNPDVPANETTRINEFLDKLAAKVIYSREHFLAPAYGVQPGDTLDTIADRYRVPPLLLARINGIRKPDDLRPGMSLKVLNGPFSAHISTERSEMWMMLEGRYAGRFPLALSGNLQNVSGLFTVRAKSPPSSGNGAGEQWIELSSSANKINIQTAPDVRTAARRSQSTIWLSEQDMDDVFGILSVRSEVVIQR